MPGRVVLEPPVEVLEEQLRDAALLDLLVDGAVLVGDHLAGQQRRLAVDREGAAGLVDVGGLAHQAGRLVDLRLAAAGHDHDLDPGPVAGLQPARLGQREAALGVAEERAALAEQGAVEVGVDASQCHRCGRYGSRMPAGGSPTGPSTWPQPVAAGIVNVTVDSMFEGARSGTPEQAIADGLALVEAGFDMLDVGAVAAKSGPPVAGRGRGRGAGAGDRGAGRGGGAGLAPTPSRSRSRGRRWRRGRSRVNDISGGSEEMFELVAETRLRLRADAHRGAAAGRPRRARVRRRRRAPEVLVRGESRARRRALGSARSRSRSTPASTSTSAPSRTWRSCGGSASCATLGLPLYVSLSRKDFIGAVLAGSWEERLPAGEREWGTVAAVALAVRGGADVLRIHDRSSLQAMRVAADPRAIGRPERTVRRGG